MNDFNFISPVHISEASKLNLSTEYSSLLYAGGLDSLGLIKNKIIHPDTLINLKTIKGLDGITYKENEGLKIGALTKITDIADNKIINDKFIAVAETAKKIASPQLRNVGTIGGNICQRPRCWYFRDNEFPCIRKGGDECFAFEGENKYHCVIGGGPCYIVHPSDLAVTLLAMNAELEIFSKGKYFKLPINKFFVLPEVDNEKENVLEPGEVISQIIIPQPGKNSYTAFIKVMEREVWDFATVSAAASVFISDGKIKINKIVLGGVAPIPWDVRIVSNRSIDITKPDETIAAVTKDILKDAQPLADNKYKVILARNIVKRLLLNFINR